MGRSIFIDTRGWIVARHTQDDMLEDSDFKADDETDEVPLRSRTHGGKNPYASDEEYAMSQPILSTYSAAFKEGAVQLAVESQQPIAQMAYALGVNAQTFHTWIWTYHRVGHQA
jgi:hypothetical protein